MIRRGNAIGRLPHYTKNSLSLSTYTKKVEHRCWPRCFQAISMFATLQSLISVNQTASRNTVLPQERKLSPRNRIFLFDFQFSKIFVE